MATLSSMDGSLSSRRSSSRLTARSSTHPDETRVLANRTNRDGVRSSARLRGEAPKDRGNRVPVRRHVTRHGRSIVHVGPHAPLASVPLLDVVDENNPTRPSRSPDSAIPKMDPVKDLELECSICLDPPNDLVTIVGCRHAFCYACLMDWSRQENSCPLCTQRFTHVLHQATVVAVATRNQQAAIPSMANAPNDLNHAYVAHSPVVAVIVDLVTPTAGAIVADNHFILVDSVPRTGTMVSTPNRTHHGIVGPTLPEVSDEISGTVRTTHHTESRQAVIAPVVTTLARLGVAADTAMIGTTVVPVPSEVSTEPSGTVTATHHESREAIVAPKVGTTPALWLRPTQRRRHST